MGTIWLPGFRIIPGNSSGSWAPDDEDAPKLVGHTTEGPSIASAVSAFTANNSWPHVTADPLLRDKAQHVGLDRPARALRNTSAPGQTNREPRVYQVEIVGTARTVAPAGQRSVLEFTDDELEWLGAEVFAPIARATGVPLTTSLTFYGDRAGFTLASEHARQRLSAAAFDTYRGVLGHQHVPENSHWDPGPIDMAKILAAARGETTAPPPPEEITVSQADRIIKHAEDSKPYAGRLTAADPRDPDELHKGRVVVVTASGFYPVNRPTLNALYVRRQIQLASKEGPHGPEPDPLPIEQIADLPYLRG